MTEEEAQYQARKALEDLNIFDESFQPASIVFVEKDNFLLPEKGPFYLVSYPYGGEDFGYDTEGRSRAFYMVTVLLTTGLAFKATYKIGQIQIGYDVDNDQYFEIE